MDDDGLYSALLQRLNTCGTAAPVNGDTGINITRWNNTEVSPALLLHLTPQSLRARVDVLKSDAATVFPGTDPEIGALQLLLVHIQEAVETRSSNQRDLFVREGGVWPERGR